MDSNEYMQQPLIVEYINKFLAKKKEKAKTPELIELYKENGIITKKLMCGDYMFNEILVEHKGKDYCSSVSSDLIFQQAQDMLYTKEQNPNMKLFIMISETPTSILDDEHPVNVEAMVAAWARLNKTIPTSFLGNEYFFVVGLIDTFEKHYDGKIKEYSPVRKPQEFDDIVLSNYVSLVGEKTAEKLIKKFPYPRLLYNATKEQLMEVDKIGESTADFLLNVIEGREKSWKALEEKKKIIKENKIAIKEAKKSKIINKYRDPNRDPLLPDFI
jgi:ERCC4-type nuclease